MQGGGEKTDQTEKVRRGVLRLVVCGGRNWSKKFRKKEWKKREGEREREREKEGIKERRTWEA